MDTQERKLIRRAVVVFAIWYLAFVAWCAVWKLAVPLLDARLSWPEVFYGPALTTGSCFPLFYGGCKLERWIKDRARRP
jgi:hypothetical protein